MKEDLSLLRSFSTLFKLASHFFHHYSFVHPCGLSSSSSSYPSFLRFRPDHDTRRRSSSLSHSLFPGTLHREPQHPCQHCATCRSHARPRDRSKHARHHRRSREGGISSSPPLHLATLTNTRCDPRLTRDRDTWLWPAVQDLRAFYGRHFGVHFPAALRISHSD